MDEKDRFLPPEPPGPEPDLEMPPDPPPPPPPPPPQAAPPPGYYQPPPQAGPPPGYYQPQPPAQQQQWPPPPPGSPAAWAQPLAPPVPGNSQAIAGFVMSVTAAALLVVSFGFSSIISITLAVLGMVFSSKGRRNVDEGRTPKHRDLARAGFITGAVALVLTILATAAWIAVLVASNE